MSGKRTLTDNLRQRSQSGDGESAGYDDHGSAPGRRTLTQNMAYQPRPASAPTQESDTLQLKSSTANPAAFESSSVDTLPAGLFGHDADLIDGEALQRKETNAATTQAGVNPHEVAAAGVSGPASQFPHAPALSASYGQPITAQAHFGAEPKAACHALGAEAFAIGNHVAFASDGPSLELAGHEAAHTLQQAQGVQLKGGIGQSGDVYEKAADQAAGFAARGESAAHLFDGPMAPASGTAVQLSPAPDGPTPDADAGLPPPDVAADYNAVVALAHLGTRRPQGSGDEQQHQLDGVAQGILARLASANRTAHDLVPFARRRVLQSGALRATSAAFGILRVARGLRAGRSGPIEGLARLLDVHRAWMQLPELNAVQFIASEPAPAERTDSAPRTADREVDVEGSSEPGATAVAPPIVFDELEQGYKDATASLESLFNFRGIGVRELLGNLNEQDSPSIEESILKVLAVAALGFASGGISAAITAKLVDDAAKALANAVQTGIDDGMKEAAAAIAGKITEKGATSKSSYFAGQEAALVPLEEKAKVALNKRETAAKKLIRGLDPGQQQSQVAAQVRAINAFRKSVRETATAAQRAQYDSSLTQWLIGMAQGKAGIDKETGGTNLTKATHLAGEHPYIGGGPKTLGALLGSFEATIYADIRKRPIKVQGATIWGLTEAVLSKIKDRTVKELGCPIVVGGKVFDSQNEWVAGGSNEAGFGINESGGVYLSRGSDANDALKRVGAGDALKGARIILDEDIGATRLGDIPHLTGG